MSDAFLQEEAEDEVNLFVNAGFVKGEFPNEDVEDAKSWRPAGPWVAVTVDVNDTFACNPIVGACDKFTTPDVWVATADCACSEVAVCNPPDDEVFFDDPGLPKLASNPGPDACWDCNEGTAVLWDCKTGPP